MLDAMHAAHIDVCKATTDTGETGTTTLAGGVLLTLVEPHVEQLRGGANKAIVSGSPLPSPSRDDERDGVDGPSSESPTAAGDNEANEHAEASDDSDVDGADSSGRLKSKAQSRASDRGRKYGASSSKGSNHSTNASDDGDSASASLQELVADDLYDEGDDTQPRTKLERSRSDVAVSSSSRRALTLVREQSRTMEPDTVVAANSVRVSEGNLLGTSERPTRYVFVFACVGDVKVFRCVPARRSGVSECCVYDLTRARTSAGEKSADADSKFRAEDCGGRIGPMHDKSAVDARGHGTRADLRNLMVLSEPCERGDILLLMSDGVADNLDPEVLGREPSRGGRWRDVPEVRPPKDKKKQRKEKRNHHTNKHQQTSFLCRLNAPTKSTNGDAITWQRLWSPAITIWPSL